MLLTQAQSTSAGPVRENNEDFIARWPPDGDRRTQTVGQVWIMADGVGGESRGEVASELAVAAVLETLENAPAYAPIPDLQKDVVENANRAVHDTAQSTRDKGRMATTLAISIFRENSLHVTHVGDTRVYLVRQGMIRQLTTDHCYIAPSVKLRLTHEHRAMIDPRRSVLTRSVGHQPTVKFDASRVALARGDIVVQCTDGLYAFVTADELANIVSHLEPEAACQQIMAAAEKRQLDDNLSVQIIKVVELDPIAYRQGVPVYRREDKEPVAGELEAGQLLDGQYEVIELIHRSAMASVFKARDVHDGRIVAIKAPLPNSATDENVASRFQREEEISRPLDHPFVLKVLPAGVRKSRPYMVMEFLEGRTLDAVLAANRPLPEAQAARIAAQVCDALEYLHQHGIIHRDLKPQNIMICDDGSIRILDFGIARSSRMRRLTFVGFTPAMGTPDYMSPEQVNGRRGDLRTDIYSLGAILYEMTTGKLPFEGESPYVTMNLRATGDPAAPRVVNPDLTPQIEEIILHALARQPLQRYASAAQMKEHLENYSKVELTGRNERLEPVASWRRRSRLVPMIIAFVLIQAAIIAALYWYFSRHAHG
ncbi:MAG TPA: bifunctional protein-serine/threonine kinase/phosphatase [Candidatus Didemnitutus sp.]|jgi:serine/threonine-protein kinase